MSVDVAHLKTTLIHKTNSKELIFCVTLFSQGDHSEYIQRILFSRFVFSCSIILIIMRGYWRGLYFCVLIMCSIVGATVTVHQFFFILLNYVVIFR